MQFDAMNHEEENFSIQYRSNSSEHHKVIQFCLPIVCLITLIITSINLWILLQKELRRRPSHFIYTNMLFLDLITIFGGVCIEISISTCGQISQNADNLFDVIYQISFYSGVLMLFGLGVCRILSMKTTAGFYVEFGIKIAYGFVIGSWLLGCFIGVLRKTILKTSKLMVVSNVSLFVFLSLTAIIINLYILVKILSVKGQIAQRTYKQASKTALLLFLNAAIWNIAYVIRCISFLVIIIRTGKMNIACSDHPWIWRMLFCGFVQDHEVRHVVEFVFLAESLGNNLILLTQPESRAILKYAWRQVREAMFDFQNSNQGYEHLIQ